MITIDITMFIHILNMIILMVVLNVLLYKPILGILEKRSSRVDSLNRDIEQFEENARHRQAEVDKKMREASRRAKQALDAARNEANAAGAEKIGAIRKEVEGKKEKQLAEIRAQIETASKELSKSTAEFAREMAAKILGRSLEA